MNFILSNVRFFCYKFFTRLEKILFFVFIYRIFFFALLLMLYVFILLVDALCFNFLTHLTYSMWGGTDTTTQKFVMDSGGAKSVECSTIAHMFENAREAGAITVPTGPGRIIGDNLFEQPVKVYTRANLDIVDTSRLGSFSRAYIKVGTYLSAPEVNACGEFKGRLLTHVHAKK
jgi:hypothetical protein